eukprot:scaffold4687_cov117-Isochrysis_galbana.AAC.7
MTYVRARAAASCCPLRSSRQVPRFPPSTGAQHTAGGARSERSVRRHRGLAALGDAAAQGLGVRSAAQPARLLGGLPG